MKFNQLILATVWDAIAFSAWADDSYQHIRNAAAKVEYAGQTFLIDPFFTPKHFLNGSAGTFNSQAKMPLVGLPVNVSKILGGMNVMTVTHTHENHWDETAARSILKNLPIYVQHHVGTVRTRSQGFADVRVLNGNTAFNGVTTSKADDIHGTEAMYANPQLAEILGDAMGVVFQGSRHRTAYVMDDTVWTTDVNRALNRCRPDYLIMNVGYALISGISDGIIMGTADILKVNQIIPKTKIITVHMDTVNHTVINHADIRKFIRGQGTENRVNVLGDGEILKLD